MLPTYFRWPGLLRLLFFAVVVISYASLASAAHEDLRAREGLPFLALYTEEGKVRTYSRLAQGERATFVFCGQGELRVLSRAVMHRAQKAARYTLDLGLDGARPGHELDYRVAAADATRFESSFAAGELRRKSFDLPRGCHTVLLSLARSSVEAVAIRLLWEERAPTQRRWRDTVMNGGRQVVVEVGEVQAPYTLIGSEEAAEVVVTGPAWVRVRWRSIGAQEVASLALEVRRNGRRFRDYQLSSTSSREAYLKGRSELILGKAREVVFPVAAGQQRLALHAEGGGGILLRAQVAERDKGRALGLVQPSWEVRPRLAIFYDNNILRYSDKFVQRFTDGRDPDRFRVGSLDDSVQRVDVAVSRGFAGLGGRPAKVGVDLQHRAYQRNSIKDWSDFGLKWRQALRHRRRVEVALNWVPDFYVRHLRDSDLTGVTSSDPFQAFEFERVQGRVDFSHQVSAAIDARYRLGLASFRHSAAFREFDSENLFAGLRLDHRVTRQWRLSYGLEVTESSARGYDQAGESRATSDDTDPSYRQVDVMLAARIRLPSQRRQVLFLQAEAGLRDYTTNKSPRLAPLHASREDDLLRLYASWQLDLTPRYRLTLFGQSRSRSSTAPIDLDIGVEKDYDQYEVGVRISAGFGR